MTDTTQPCPGSGQRVAPWTPSPAECPVCGRRIALDPYAQLIVTHYPEAAGAVPLDLWAQPESERRS